MTAGLQLADPPAGSDHGTALAAASIAAASIAVNLQRWAAVSPRALLVDAIQVTPDLGVVVTFPSAMSAAEVAGRLGLAGPERVRPASDVVAWEGLLQAVSTPVRVVVEGNIDRAQDAPAPSGMVARPAAFCPRCGTRLGVLSDAELDAAARVGEELTDTFDCPWCLTATFRGDL